MSRADEIIAKWEADLYDQIPFLANVIEWLNSTGFHEEKIYGNYKGDSISERTCRAIIYGRKVR